MNRNERLQALEDLVSDRMNIHSEKTQDLIIELEKIYLLQEIKENMDMMTMHLDSMWRRM